MKIRVGRGAFAVLLAAAGLVAAEPSVHAAPAPQPSVRRAAAARAVPKLDRDHLFVRFRSRPADAATRLAQAGALAPHALPGTAWTTVATNGNAITVKAQLERDPTVAQVQYSYIRKATGDIVPNDPKWASVQRDYLGPLRMDQAWGLSEGNNVKVAVIDTGVDAQHPDLAGRVLTGIDETATSPNANDDNGHGTMVAGIIAADINNHRGVAGIAPLAKILPIKVLDADGQGSDTTIAAGINDAVTSGAQIINLSLGGIAFDQPLCDAVSGAVSANVVVVAAAGNDGDDQVEYPAACPGAVAVSATGHSGALTAFSSFGPRIDLAAPGLDITSTVPGASPTSDSYAIGSGTSFSAPIVTGAFALVKSQTGHSGSVLISDVLLHARDAGPPGKDPAFGVGIVDPVAALGGVPLTPMYVTSPGGDEPNDTPNHATTLTVGVTHAAAIAPETDQDWYTIALSAGWYTVHVPSDPDLLDHKMDPVVQVYDATEHLLASQEFAGGDLTFHVTSAGNYFVNVRNRGADTASYTVRVSSVSTPGLFASPVDFPVDSTAQSIGVGDLNGDGRNDVAFLMGDDSAIADTLVVLDQTPDRSFVIGDVVDAPFFSTPGTGLVVANVVGDNKPDVLFPTDDGVAVMQQESGHLDPFEQVISAPNTTRVAVADLDNDSHPDIITSSQAGLQVWWGPTFAGPPLTITSRQAASLVADGTHVVRVAGSDVTEYTFSGRAAPASANATEAGAANVTIDHPTGDVVVTQQTGDDTPGKVVVLSNGATVRTIGLAEPNPDPVTTASLGGVTNVVTLHDTTGDIGLVPLNGGSETLFLGDAEAQTRYDGNALAVRDIDNDGAPDVTIGTLFGITMLMHRFDSLPENYGQTLVHAVSPISLSTGAATGVTPALTLNQASTNAGTNVQLLNAQGVVVGASPVANGTTVTISPSSALTSGAAYAIDADGLHDAAGDAIAGYPSGFVVGTPVNTDAALHTPPSGFVATANVSFTFSSHDPNATFACSVDNADYTACTSPKAVTVAAGAHTFRVFAKSAGDTQESAPVVATWTYRPPPHGYWMVGAHGTVYPFGSVPGLGNGATSNAVDIDASPSGFGYWVADASGHVFAFGDAKFHGNASGLRAGETVTSISRTKSGNGYWLFTNKGRVFPFGDAHSFGDMSSKPLNAPVLDSVATASGNGYYMVAADGGVFTFGDAKFFGSTGSMHLNAPVRTMVVDPDGTGYWLIANDGGVFSFQAPFRGSMGGKPLNRPMVGGVAFGNGYLMVGSDGGIFDFSNKPFFGSLGGNPPAVPIVSVAAFA
jgi:subtilisin family serine protease